MKLLKKIKLKNIDSYIEHRKWLNSRRPWSKHGKKVLQENKDKWDLIIERMTK